MKMVERMLRGKSTVTVALIMLATAAMALGALPVASHSGSAYVGVNLSPSVSHTLARAVAGPPAAPAVKPASGAPSGFPRTVLAEPFTEAGR